MVSELEFGVTSGAKTIPVLISRPSDDVCPGSCFVLGHGASGEATTGNLPAIAARLSAAGFLVLRYSCAGQLPARTKALQAVLDSEIEALQGVNRWILAGHSMGGRTACAVARERADVAAVVLFSYPLHPPGKQDELRDQDLTALEIPVLIVRGSKDPFSNEPVFQEAMARMRSRQLQVCAVEGGDHSLGTKTKVGQQRFEEWMSTVEGFVRCVLTPETDPAAAEGVAAAAKGGEAASKETAQPATKAAKRKASAPAEAERGTPKGRKGAKKNAA